MTIRKRVLSFSLIVCLVMLMLTSGIALATGPEQEPDDKDLLMSDANNNVNKTDEKINTGEAIEFIDGDSLYLDQCQGFDIYETYDSYNLWYESLPNTRGIRKEPRLKQMHLTNLILVEIVKLFQNQ